MPFNSLSDVNCVEYAPGIPEDAQSSLVNFVPLRDWLRNFPAEWRLDKLEIQSVDMFRAGFIGFAKIKATIFNTETGQFLPGIVFLRGGAVAILLVIARKSDGKEFAVLTTQPRAPVGQRWLSEIPAGMLDGSSKFSGVAARELKEEAGIELDSTNLVDLTSLAYGSAYPGMYTSGGGCDEFMRIFYSRLEYEDEELEKLQGKIGGEDEHETIKLRIVPLEDLPFEAPDSKALGALALLSACRSRKLL